MHNKNHPGSFEEFLHDSYGGLTLDGLKQTHKNNRALAVGRYFNLLKAEEKRSQADKKKWIAKARAAFNPGPKQPCTVCGKYQSVTHAHHVRPLHTQYGSPTFTEDFVWLCPTHHEGVHVLLTFIAKCKSWPSFDGFSEEEKLAMTRIAAMGV